MGSSTSGLYSTVFVEDVVKQNDQAAISTLRKVMKAFGIGPDENTATVWNQIVATQDEYPGTHLPRSFIVRSPSGDFWTHAHGTKHMYSAVQKALKSTDYAGANHGMLTQFLLYDYRKSIISATKSGIHLDGRARTYGHWELGFSQRPDDKYPVVMHARFNGLN